MRNDNFLFLENDLRDSRKRDPVLFQCCADIRTHRTRGKFILLYLETLMRRPIQPLLNIQSLCTFRLPTAITLPFSALSSPLSSFSPFAPLLPPDSLSLLDLPLRACVYSALYLADFRDSLCFEIHYYHRVAVDHGSCTHSATAEESQMESAEHTHLNLDSEGSTCKQARTLDKIATKARGKATQPRRPPDKRGTTLGNAPRTKLYKLFGTM